MKTPHALRAGAVIVAALACLVAMASPASATTHTYNVGMESGRISVGTINFDTPGSGATGCPASTGTGITGTINDVTNVITGTLTITSLFALPWPFTGNYALIATGSGTGTWNNATGTFSSLTINPVAYTIRNVVVTGTGTTTVCTVGTTVVCSGTASLHASGGLYNGATLPLSTSEKIYVNATGTILTRNTPCNFPFSAIITVGTSLTLADNPNDDVAPAGTDPGAIFHQA